ncbi:uncharacterized protein ACA1_063830 [Acanthamoeba castellanii str. Neff]|uniref:Uncharacterized protein n=1 Tax=Acanthamoeba castellanii (strain ATCC 30010 / Neff) TaxID=1257118 RepID=L8GWP1_ACACF|nr:uncharacterized protein ACA1_063830 [Acanthamoeba castellanii str. Neff]ELR17619.1 hypothetical protein ACA1_063830 [Acanthamoeba castellanii str. Neff]
MEQDEEGSRDDRLPKRGRYHLHANGDDEGQELEHEEDGANAVPPEAVDGGRSGSLFAELALAAAKAKEHVPAIESNLLWYQRRAAGLATDLSGDGAFSYNFRTRQGALFQIDPDSLPAPLPKPGRRTALPPPRDDDDDEKAEGEEEVCLYDPEQSEEMAVPVGYHRASKFVAGREVIYLREGTGEEEDEDEDKGEEEKRNRATATTTATSPTEKGKEREREPPADESPAAPQDASAREEESEKQDDNAPVDRGHTAQPPKKRWRD